MISWVGPGATMRLGGSVTLLAVYLAVYRIPSLLTFKHSGHEPIVNQTDVAHTASQKGTKDSVTCSLIADSPVSYTHYDEQL
mmetsp:Transcript_25007/g.34257  ORF Transcript_25007/g.34257 Transcript_25007/m.34257 type:complete len:82 (-) Transcript_25007:150-395(-)